MTTSASAFRRLLFLLCAAYPTTQGAPGETTGSGPENGVIPAVPVSAPVDPKVTEVRMSPEQLVRASIPWQGQDSPWRQPGGPSVGGNWRLNKFVRANYGQRNPWDADSDASQGHPFAGKGPSGVVALHPPPFIPGRTPRPVPEQSWMNVVQAPVLKPNAPAFYGTGFKPRGYYMNPLGGATARGAAFLQLGEAQAAEPRPRVHPAAAGSRVAWPPAPWATSAYRVRRRAFRREAAVMLLELSAQTRTRDRSRSRSSAGGDPFYPPKFQPMLNSERNYVPPLGVYWDVKDAKAIRDATNGNEFWTKNGMMVLPRINADGFRGVDSLSKNMLEYTDAPPGPKIFGKGGQMAAPLNRMPNAAAAPGYPLPGEYSPMVFPGKPPRPLFPLDDDSEDDLTPSPTIVPM